MFQLSSEGVGQRQRVERWEERTTELFGTHQRITAPPEAEFNVRLRAAQVGEFRALQIQGTPHRSQSVATADGETVLVRLQVSGEARFRVDHIETDIRPGQLMLLPLMGANDFRFASDYEQVSIALSRTRLSSVCPSWKRIAMRPFDAKEGATALLAGHLISLAKNATHFGPESTEVSDITLGLVAVALSAVSDCNLTGSEEARALHRARVRSYIVSHLRDGQLSAHSIAHALGMSVRFLHSLFAEEDESVMRWVMQQRLARCHDLLTASPERKVGDIAHEFCFSDHAHFTNAFRKVYGCTPSELRETQIHLGRQ